MPDYATFWCTFTISPSTALTTSHPKAIFRRPFLSEEQAAPYQYEIIIDQIECAVNTPRGCRSC